MPTYDYECNACGHKLEIIQSFKDLPLKKCPECGSKKFEKLITGGAGIVFKGNGFYVTDRQQNSSTPSSTNVSNTNSNEQKTSGNTQAQESGQATSPAKMPAKKTESAS